MTVEEAQKWKRDAEDKILGVIRDLQQQTGCVVERIEFDVEETATFMPPAMRIKIDLRIR